MRANPFYELYLTDSMPSRDFISLFSPIMIPHVQQVFLPGNIVIVGMQGAGKSMLLKLLNAETRFIYEKEGAEFPVPKELRRFISCNVNLAHSNSIDFGLRSLPGNDSREVEMLFGDFVNTLLVIDLMNTVAKYVDHGTSGLRNEVGVQADHRKLDIVALELARSDLWSGWLAGVLSWSDLAERLGARVVGYRGFLNRRKKELAAEIVDTKTSFGEPIAEFVEHLKRLDVLKADTNVFVDIDQYEELGNIRVPEDVSNHPVDYRAVIKRGLARRDGRVSYRVGARPHSWRQHTAVLGSIGKLEEERDYKYVDLDLLLKRYEDARTYIFPKFAEDVFRRRLVGSGLGVAGGETITMDRVYSKSLTPAQKGIFYNPEGNVKAINIAQEWKRLTAERLTSLARKDILSARLGEAWIRQKGDVFDLGVRDELLPWQAQKWWRKERTEVALLQIASSNQQRPLYTGAEEITEIANGNILTFISINQHIWDQYLRYETRQAVRQNTIPEIGKDLQSIGILKASEHWFNKLNEETGRSSERIAFIREVSRVLREDLMGDRKLSNPGASGFSLRQDELIQFPALHGFLGELSDYGNLTMLSHTTKEKNKAARTKWYIAPILCPHLRLPYNRPKEPRYVSVKLIYSWLERAKISLPTSSARFGDGRPTPQKTLFE